MATILEFKPVENKKEKETEKDKETKSERIARERKEKEKRDRDITNTDILNRWNLRGKKRDNPPGGGTPTSGA